MSENEPRKFDLNMEEVLEAWGVEDATREVIANALDEQILSDTADVEIFEDDRGRWHVRDYGRGLRHEHLTQNEDEEKLDNPDQVIGKFGVGLKDALATFHRNDVDVTIHSSHQTIRVEKAPKSDFEDIETLHGFVSAPERDIEGTDVVLDGLSETSIEQAKRNFLRFTDDVLLERTKFGEVYATPDGESSRIYVTGLKVAEEEDFLFSYNISKTTKQVRDKLNRERSNVGRTAYRSRVQDILQECESSEVAQRLVEDSENFTDGTIHDEVSWKPIHLHAVKLLSAQEDVMFATVDEQQSKADLVDHARSDGLRVVTVPDTIRADLGDKVDVDGNEIRDVTIYREEFNDSHEFEWVSEQEMTDAERQVWDLREEILGHIDGHSRVREIRVSETIRLTEFGDMAEGLWQPNEGRIVVRRDTLEDPSSFAGALLHEVAHARSGATDITRAFESELTVLLGELSSSAVKET